MALRQLVGVLLVLVLVSGAVGPAVAAPPAGTSPSLDGAAAAQDNFSQPTFVITVHENGSARWTFQYTRPLNNETARENFEAIRDLVDHAAAEGVHDRTWHTTVPPCVFRVFFCAGVFFSRALGSFFRRGSPGRGPACASTL